MPRSKREMAIDPGQPREGAPVEGGAQGKASGCSEDDSCRCDGCINVNYPRSQAVKDAEFRELCLRICTPEQIAWHKAFRPETWVLSGEQVEMFK